jgi:ABC-type transport system involved in cytochrome c biogenesis ATPase subunit
MANLAHGPYLFRGTTSATASGDQARITVAAGLAGIRRRGSDAVARYAGAEGASGHRGTEANCRLRRRMAGLLCTPVWPARGTIAKRIARAPQRTGMRLEAVRVSGLFGRFTHELTFPPNERITIMIGPNGFGKTMILRILDALFNQPLRSLGRLPFAELAATFDDHSEVRVRRLVAATSPAVPTPPERRASVDVEVSFRNASGHEYHFTPGPPLEHREVSFPMGLIEEAIPLLERVAPRAWRHRQTGETLELDEILERYEEDLPRPDRPAPAAAPDWLQTIRDAIPVRFIDTERLTHPPTHRNRSTRLHRFGPAAGGRTVRRFSEELAERVKRTLTEYGALAQSLDRTFPARLVESPPGSDMTMAQLRAALTEVDAKRASLVEAGLLAPEQEEWGVPVPALEKVDQSRLGVLAVYARDAKQKLSVFDDLYARISSLQRIANSRFLHKQVVVSSEGLCVRTAEGSQLDLEMLSSGEQHELVLFYELLFRVRDNSLILIDEPELSLHVAWQEQFLSDLQGIAELGKFRVLMATHSPQIIADRWDLTVELRAPNGK